ncbi:MAG TPA: Clp protease N-terminal domain-containing protein [Gaiellaceae bacterium]|nr:Clp protease N-terminal domain-containing protein [Gaiellaceae bacterium]
MFERFTERARQVVVLAQDEARALRHNYIGTEHILLGLLREEEGLAARVLESLEITVEEARVIVAAIVGHGDEATTGQIPFTPRAKKVLEHSLREALSLGHDYIGTEHILLGLVREHQGVAARVLLEFNADAEKVRNQVIHMLSGVSRRGDPVDWVELEAYQPTSPPFTDDVLAELDHLRSEMTAALGESDFERAAGARQRYSQLARAARRLERAWRNEDPAPEAPHHRVGGFMTMPAPVEPMVRRTRGLRRMPRPVALYEAERPPHRALLLGYVLFAIAFAIGVMSGWLIWA